MPSTLTRQEIIKSVEARPWFHRIDLGNGIVTPGVDNSELKLNALGIPTDLTGKSVIDIGAWDGFFSFACERRGAATVVAANSYCWTQKETVFNKGGFELARQALSSNVHDVTVRVEELDPANIGRFDYVLFLGVLYHAPDPLGYLAKVRSVCNGTAIIETHVDALEIDRPALIFYPGATLNNDPSNFFGPNEAAVIALCKEVGFASVEVVNRHWLPNRMVFHAHI